MTVRWERFAGSTDTFAVRLALMSDPDAGAAAEPAEAASWGALQIWVEGQNLCTHVDQGEVLQSAHWYLLPLLEWLVENWNSLLHEEKLPNRNLAETAVASLAQTRNPPMLAGEAETVAWETEQYEWSRRHMLRAGRSGGLLPNVVFRRVRDLIEISWDDEPAAGTPPGFRYSATRGAGLVDPELVANVFHTIVGAAAEHLHDSSVDGGRVASLHQAIDNLGRREQHDRRLDWLAGLRELSPLAGRLHGHQPADEMSARWSEVVAALRASGDEKSVAAALDVDESPLVITGSCHAALLFSSLSPTVSRNDVRTLASILVGKASFAAVQSPLEQVGGDVSLNMAIPVWEQGYDLAEALHHDLALDLADGWVDIVGLLRRLRVTVDSCALDDRDIRACSLVGPQHTPTVVLNTASPFASSQNALRFTLAHELCHLLFDRSRGRKLAIASGPWAPRAIEQRANAFAAMFLMPTGLVEAAIADVPDPITDLAGVSVVAERMRVSRHAAIDHLYNLTLMGEAERDELRRRVGD